jgi:hypothetical protein
MELPRETTPWEVDSMAQCRSHQALFVLGALTGAAAALFLVPMTRRAILEGMRSAIDEARSNNSLGNDITQEAGAVEGGLAGTRRWSEAYTSRS